VRLVGELVFGEVALALLQLPDDLIEQQIEAFLLACGDGDDVGEGVECRPVGHQRQQVFFGDGVHLVEYEDDGTLQLFDQREGKVIFDCGHCHSSRRLYGDSF